LLTQLSIGDQDFSAVHLLALLQQAWPARTKPAGEGTFKAPWVLRTPGEWFWGAKTVAMHTRVNKFEVPGQQVQPSTEYWFDVAGRYISVAAATLYARDRGDVPPVPPRGAPGVQKLEISYTGLYNKLLSENGDQLNDKQAAVDFRAVLKGASPGADKVALRMLAAVMFLCEVARNTTAFHTGLMLLDLVEHGIRIDTTTFQYDFKSALWSPGTIDTFLANKTATVKQRAPDVASERSTFANTGGERSLAASMGMAPMSHELSESGGAFDLTGKGSFTPPKDARVTQVPSPLTGVRRKEATLLIRWLSFALKKTNPDLRVVVGDGERDFDFQNAYTFSDEHFANSDALADMKYIAPLLNTRSDTFDCMIQG